MSRDTASDVPPPPSAPMVMPPLGEKEVPMVNAARNDVAGTRSVVEELKGQKKRKKRKGRQHHGGGGELGGDTFVLDQCCAACFTGIAGFLEALCCLSCCENCCENGCGCESECCGCC